MEQRILEEFKKKTGITSDLIVSLPDEFDEECPSLQIMEKADNGKVWEVVLYKTSMRIKEYYEI